MRQDNTIQVRYKKVPFPDLSITISHDIGANSSMIRHPGFHLTNM